MFNPTAGNLGKQRASQGTVFASHSPPLPYADNEDQVSFYDHAVPPFAEEQLEKLYSNIMTTMARFAIYDAAPDASTYVVRRGEAVRTVFLFRLERKSIHVYNEQISLDPGELACFARRAFARYPSVDRISFYAIDAGMEAVPYPFAKYDCLEDVYLPLPENEQDYLARLGRNTRDGIKRRHKKLLRDFPSFRFDTFGKDAVSAQQIREIVAFSQARMAAKEQSCYHTEESTEKLIRLVRHYGIVSVASIDGRTCGGVIGQRLGEHHFAQIAAHDPQLDEYGLGILCNYLSICKAISDGLKVFHFGWGRYDYKYRLLGENKDLCQIDIYRGKREKWVDLRHAFNAVRAEKRRQFKLWVSGIETGAKPSEKRIASALGYLRRIKRCLP